MVQAINAALAQAKVQHPNACDILEVQLEVERTNCTIYHVLEALEGDVEMDIEQRRRSNRPYGEQELRQTLQQIAGVLAFTHGKNIAHRDVKPSNIFRTRDSYKLGDFGSFFVKRAATVTKSSAGDSRYMSPQLREACIRGTQYNPFKADVFALGAALLHMVTLASPEALLTAERLDEAVGRQVARINCSTELQALLRTMLAYQEGARPTMQQVCSALTSVSSVSREFSPPILQAGKASVCIPELSPEDVNRLMKESWPDTFNISSNDYGEGQFSTYSIDQLQITNVHKLPISSANLKRFQQTVGSLSSQTCMWLWHQ